MLPNSIQNAGAAAVIATATALAANGAAQAQPDMVIDMYSDPGEFFIEDAADYEVARFQEARAVRICADMTKHRTPLEVRYDESSAVLKPGNCLTVEAKTVDISAAKGLEPGWVLQGTVETEQHF